MHAEAVLLVDDREREIAERDVLLEQRMRADQQIDARRRRAASRMSARSLPRSRPVRIATRRPAASASGAMVVKCWRARISVGAISAACRPASITVAAASSATTVLPEPTSPCSSRSMRSRLGEIGDDVVDRARLRRRERIGQGRDDLLRAAARRRVLGRPAGRCMVRAHQRERELAGQQFVIGEPRPGRRFGRDVAPARRADAGPPAPRAKAGNCLLRAARPRPAIPAARALRPSAASTALRT